MADIDRAKHVRGRTLAEIGGGNRPSDMVAVEYNGRRSVIIANSNRTLMRMAAADIDKSEPITTAASTDKPILGTPYIPLAVVGVMQLDALNSEYIVMLLRDIDEWLDQGAYLPRQVSLTPMTLLHAAPDGTRGAGRLWARGLRAVDHPGSCRRHHHGGHGREATRPMPRRPRD